MAFINQSPSLRPQRTSLVAQLLKEQQRQHSKAPNPYSWGEAAARVGSRLIDAYMGKKQIDEEMGRRGASADNLQDAITALTEGTTKPGVPVDTVTQDPFAQRPIALDPNVFGTDADVGSAAVAPTVVSALTNMGATSADLGGRPANIPQASTAQDLMGATHVMPDGTTMLNSDMTGAMYETPQMNLGGQPPAGSQMQQAMAQQIAQAGQSQDVVQDRAAGIGAMGQVLMRDPTNASMGAELMIQDAMRTPSESFETTYNTKGQPLSQTSNLTGKVSAHPNAPKSFDEFTTTFNNKGEPIYQVNSSTGQVIAHPDAPTKSTTGVWEDIYDENNKLIAQKNNQTHAYKPITTTDPKMGNYQNVEINGNDVLSAKKDGKLYVANPSGEFVLASEYYGKDGIKSISNQRTRNQEVLAGTLLSIKSAPERARLSRMKGIGNEMIRNAARVEAALGVEGVGTAGADVVTTVDNFVNSLDTIATSYIGSTLKGVLYTKADYQADYSEGQAYLTKLIGANSKYESAIINLAFAKALMLNGARPTDKDYESARLAVVGTSNRPKNILEAIKWEREGVLNGIEGQWADLAPAEKFKFDRGGAFGGTPNPVSPGPIPKGPDGNPLSGMALAKWLNTQ